MSNENKRKPFYQNDLLMYEILMGTFVASLILWLPTQSYLDYQKSLLREQQKSYQKKEIEVRASYNSFSNVNRLERMVK